VLDHDRTLASRYECKYLVAPDTVPVIRGMVRQYMQPDRYALNRRGHRYTISSLYYDSPSLDLFLSTCEGRRNRYKLRVRSYSDDPDKPLFFEIKKRSDQVVLKNRCAVSRATASRVLAGRELTENLPEDLERFRLRMRQILAEPVLRVRYEREAYESRAHDPVRLTFDYDIQYAVTRSPDCSVGGESWHRTPIDGVVVEIKFTNTCPLWVSHLVDRLQLMHESIPKYVTSLEAALRRTRHSPSGAPLHRLDTIASPSPRRGELVI